MLTTRKGRLQSIQERQIPTVDEQGISARGTPTTNNITDRLWKPTMRSPHVKRAILNAERESIYSTLRWIREMIDNDAAIRSVLRNYPRFFNQLYRVSRALKAGKPGPAILMLEDALESFALIQNEAFTKRMVNGDANHP